jgi:hypothetical protein
MSLLLKLAETANKEEKAAIGFLYVADRFFRNYLYHKENHEKALEREILESVRFLEILEELDSLTSRLYGTNANHRQMRLLINEFKNTIAPASISADRYFMVNLDR